MASAILVDGHRLERTALARIIEDDCSLHVVAEAGAVDEVLLLSRNYCPEWLFIAPADHDPMGTLDVIMRVHCSCENTRIVLLAGKKFTPFLQRAFKAGIAACVSKSASVVELAEAVESTRKGGRYVGREYAREMVTRCGYDDVQSEISKLTNRELQIMLMFVENMKVEQIASRLFLSPKTVSTYRYRIFDKLGVRGDVALMHMAHEYGLLRPAPRFHRAA